VVRTRVGYAGGKKKDPTYQSLGDHTETIQIDYDPAVISYEGLLKIFWTSHDGSRAPWSAQYKSVIFCHDEEQKKLAAESLEREQAGRKRKIYTEVLPAGEFYRAEDYHQKYGLRHDAALMKEVRAMIPEEKGFVDSTLAARLNGFLGGEGTLKLLEEEIDRYGLSPTGRKRLLELVRKREARAGCNL
jgi:peptide-methionine (S)-S-oxide reductase